MEAFLQMKWPYRDLELKDRAISMFLPEEMTKDFYITENIEKPIQMNSNSEVVQKYVPGLKHIFTHTIKSSLDKNQQIQCLLALALYQNGKQKLNNEDQAALKAYNELKPLIYEENKKFQEYAKDHWESRSQNPSWIKYVELQNFAQISWMKKLSSALDYPQDYKKKDIISISYSEDDRKMEMVNICNLLEMGDVGKFQSPSLKSKVLLKPVTYPRIQQEQSYYSKLPVSQDTNINLILKEIDADIVISSSAIKKLIYSDKSTESWNIPVIVKQIAGKNVIFIDKPFPKAPNYMDFNEKCYKMMLKTNFCQFKAFSYEHNEIAIEETIVEKEEKATVLKQMEQKVFKIRNNKKQKKNSVSENELTSTVHHNVTYRMWELRQKFDDQNGLLKAPTTMKPIKIIVRNKLDGCELNESNALQPVTVIPKLEYQLEYGARLPTKNELVKQWASIFFRPFSRLYRVLLHSFTSEIIAVEPCNVNKITNELLTHYNYNPNLGIGVLYKLFSSLMPLQPGKYLLHYAPEQGQFANLMEETSPESGTLNISHIYENMKLVQLLNQDIPWTPIDTNMVLPAHIELKQMPGLFKGYRYGNAWKEILMKGNTKKKGGVKGGKIKKKPKKKKCKGGIK